MSPMRAVGVTIVRDGREQHLDARLRRRRCIRVYPPPPTPIWAVISSEPRRVLGASDAVCENRCDYMGLACAGNTCFPNTSNRRREVAEVKSDRVVESDRFFARG